MDIKAPTTLVAAWVLVPLLVTLLSAGLGLGLRLLAGRSLGVLTLPAGMLAGIALVGALLELGIGGRPAAFALLVAALAGPAWGVARERSELRRALGERAAVRLAAWAAVAGVAAYAIALAPLAGSGRSGILGYVLNNDSAAHVMLVEWIAANSAEPAAVRASSFTSATSAFADGYPLGNYAWPAVSTALTGIDPFHTWTPLIALTAGMLAIVAFALLRRLDAPGPLAAAGGALAATGYLPLSYLAQGGAKELVMPLSILGAVALAAHALDRPLAWRALIPAAIAAAAAIANLGYSALAWLGPGGLAIVAIVAVRARRGRGGLRELRALGAIGLAGALIALPAAIESIQYFRAARLDLEDPNEVGNLLGALPLAETLNVWLALDYRSGTPDLGWLTWLGAALAALAALAGLAYALARRDLGVPLALGTAVIGAALVYPRVSIYFEAKTLVVVAPALGVLTAAGVLGVARSSRRGARPAAAALGGTLALLALASSAYVYAGVWNTPRDRFQELADIGERYAGQGPLLVNEREYYADHLLRETDSWNAWSERTPFRELRTEGDLPPPLPATPDFDHYDPGHLHRFKLLLERKRPGGSRPPANFDVDSETRYYRVWKRTGPDPVAHVPFGADLDGSAPLRCEAVAVRRVLRQARAEGRELLVATRPGAPVRAFQLDAWVGYDRVPVQPPDEFVGRRGGTGFAAGAVELPPGRYRAWLPGSYGPGVRLWVGPAPAGDVVNDLGIPSQWFDVGVFDSDGETSLSVTSLRRSLLRPGSRHHELSGPVWVEPADAGARVERVSPADVRRLCGRPVDWLALPAA